MRRKIATVVAVLTLLATAPLLSACYTAQGAGKDLKAAGQGLDNTAQKNTTYRP